MYQELVLMDELMEETVGRVRTALAKNGITVYVESRTHAAWDPSIERVTLLGGVSDKALVLSVSVSRVAGIAVNFSAIGQYCVNPISNKEVLPEKYHFSLMDSDGGFNSEAIDHGSSNNRVDIGMAIDRGIAWFKPFIDSNMIVRRFSGNLVLFIDLIDFYSAEFEALKQMYGNEASDLFRAKILSRLPQKLFSREQQAMIKQHLAIAKAG